MSKWNKDELAKLDKEQAKQRKRLLERTIEDVRRVLDNTDGLERLTNISDEEWNAAVARSGDVGNAA